ncbi:hypothetical protein QFZ22_008235 [Streptomyces canus]|uniref:Uncharacterized protein n=1 Tax=Streptomyces canus TaxID=58343 RepID=A0AAW8FT81_9ACTN|nr:hypothetical protein [Streptomyces canus]
MSRVARPRPRARPARRRPAEPAPPGPSAPGSRPRRCAPRARVPAAACCSNRPTARMSSSPAANPAPSLTCLKWSTSSRLSANVRPAAIRRSTSTVIASEPGSHVSGLSPAASSTRVSLGARTRSASSTTPTQRPSRSTTATSSDVRSRPYVGDHVQDLPRGGVDPHRPWWISELRGGAFGVQGVSVAADIGGRKRDRCTERNGTPFLPTSRPPTRRAPRSAAPSPDPRRRWPATTRQVARTPVPNDRTAVATCQRGSGAERTPPPREAGTAARTACPAPTARRPTAGPRTAVPSPLPRRRGAPRVRRTGSASPVPPKAGPAATRRASRARATCRQAVSVVRPRPARRPR